MILYDVIEYRWILVADEILVSSSYIAWKYFLARIDLPFSIIGSNHHTYVYEIYVPKSPSTINQPSIPLKIGSLPFIVSFSLGY